jgi:hypothetical protein
MAENEMKRDSQESNIAIYTTDDGQAKLQVSCRGKLGN